LGANNFGKRLAKCPDCQPVRDVTAQPTKLAGIAATALSI
jgi:hypothetical protein